LVEKGEEVDTVSRKIQVTPGGLTRSAAGLGAVVAVLFLIFGVIFFWVIMSDTSSFEDGLWMVQIAFLVIWVVGCLVIVIVNLRVFVKARIPADASLFEVEDDAGEQQATTSDAAFDIRLRKLESLHKEGLITEDEYERKRAEILGEKW
jgi:hypothetical protein